MLKFLEALIEPMARILDRLPPNAVRLFTAPF